jgi:phytoene dehydrogenase-like protein
MFLLYLGIKGNLEKIYSEKCNLWYFCTYDIERIYQEMSYNIPKKIECLACSFPSIHDQALENKNKGTMTLFMLAPYKDKGFWVKNKFLVGEMLIKKIEEIIPGLSKIIETRIHGTPFDLYSYTLNRNGAFVGWRSNLNQSKSSLLPQRTSLPGLYLVGHWCTMGYRGQGGIPNVAFSGKRAAYLILKNHFKSH